MLRLWNGLFDVCSVQWNHDYDIYFIVCESVTQFECVETRHLFDQMWILLLQITYGAS